MDIFQFMADTRFLKLNNCLGVLITQLSCISTIMIFCELYAVSTLHDI